MIKSKVTHARLAIYESEREKTYHLTRASNEDSNQPEHSRILIRVIVVSASLRNHAYSNILKILPPKNEHFQIIKI